MFFKINKKRGISSFKAIKQFAKASNIKKIGHAGTLDPLAEGLLIVATDEDTKALHLLSTSSKEYIVAASLNKRSASYDEGEEVNDVENPRIITKEELLEALKKIKKTKKQIPPAFSAKKINGVRSYHLARNNKQVNLSACDIEIFKLELLAFNAKNQTFRIKTKVSKGTYIRSLIHDIGLLLKTDAVVNFLQRVAIDEIKLGNEDYAKIDDLDNLFNMKIINVSANQLPFIYKNFKIIKNDEYFHNEKNIFAFNNLIIGWGYKKMDNFYFEKIFLNRIEKLIKEIK
ncbi:tRNA pseudouridine(55) synthase TruB [Mycoplasma phocoeninasale]|uniref:tRNA pseudouridine(55) synthase n=1 Tax=Mycoplasma phocoeninasale TaxID=2726117 RepID=A0A858U5M9_9MOLU|nr:tRNA pseudouridine(55) synthase TruB [Mycoplasma phocoeninasale]QJG66118.1 tRNA pseudouridine(55) synthase TruB [Mycoplasma phocoeninasale]